MSGCCGGEKGENADEMCKGWTAIFGEDRITYAQLRKDMIPQKKITRTVIVPPSLQQTTLRFLLAVYDGVTEVIEEFKADCHTA